MKPRILVIVDIPGWSLDRTADNVMKRLGGLFAFEKAYNSTAVRALEQKNYDLVYITYERQFQDAGIDVELPRPAVIGIRSHFKWDGGRGLPPADAFLAYLSTFDALHLPSLMLRDIFTSHHPAVFHTPHGVDEQIFCPVKHNSFSSPGGRLIVGWAGSRTNHPGKRGIEDFILPAVENLSGITLRFAAREERWRTQEEMVFFYRGLDCLICASRTEGGPHPVLEASACGVPVISTGVGIAPELIKDGENGLLVERTIDAIRRAIVLLRDDADMRRRMGRRARQVVEEGWTWDIQAKKYIPFFERERNEGSLETARRGIVTGVSVLANLPWQETTLPGIAGLFDNKAGIHLNLTRGVPLSGGLRTLVDEQGTFFSKKLLWRKALARRLKPDEVEREFSAQIERLLQAGVAVDHIDGNNHIHVFPAVAAVTARLARRYGIQKIRLPLERFFLHDIIVSKTVLKKTLMQALSLNARVVFRRSGLVWPDFFFGIGRPRTAEAASVRGFMRTVPGGTSELMCHPGFRSGSGNIFSGAAREREVAALTDRDVMREVRDQSINLISYSDM